MTTLNIKVNCGEYRKTMELLGLKNRLQKDDLTPQERKSIEDRIKELEKELNLV